MGVSGFLEFRVQELRFKGQDFGDEVKVLGLTLLGMWVQGG